MSGARKGPRAGGTANGGLKKSYGERNYTISRFESEAVSEAVALAKDALTDVIRIAIEVDDGDACSAAGAGIISLNELARARGWNGHPWPALPQSRSRAA